MKFNIRLLYLYLFSFIGLLIAVIGFIRLIQLGIKVYVFNGADQYASFTSPLNSPDGRGLETSPDQIAQQQKINEIESRRQRQREVSEAGAMLIAGIPLYLYHWKTIQKEASRK